MGTKPRLKGYEAHIISDFALAKSFFNSTSYPMKSVLIIVNLNLMGFTVITDSSRSGHFNILAGDCR